MRDLKKLRNLTVIVFVFLFINFVTLKDFSSGNEKPMIVVKEYYYPCFKFVEIGDPYHLNDEELKKFEFERTGIWKTLYKYIGENNTGYEIYIEVTNVDIDMNTADLIVITVKEYENPENIDFEKVTEILYNVTLMDKKREILQHFYDKILIQRSKYGVYVPSSYKLPLIYCMIENCNIGTGKRILIWNESFKYEKKTMGGPYSVQNKKGQIIVWKSLNEYWYQIDEYLYIVNAYERSRYVGGFEIDKTFMRETLEILTTFYGIDSNRNREILSKSSLSFYDYSDFIKEDAIAKWTVIPYLFARYRDYNSLYDFDSKLHTLSFDYFSEKTRMEFEYIFSQEEFEKDSRDMILMINSQIEYIFNNVKESNQNYKNISEYLHLKMENFDNMYIVIISIYGIILGFITILRKKIKNFWEGIPKYEKRAFLILFLTIIIYIIIYDSVIIYRMMLTESNFSSDYSIIRNNERSYILLFSIVIAACITIQVSLNRTKRFWKLILKKKILEIALCTIIFYVALYTSFLICGFIYGNLIILLSSLILAVIYVFRRRIIRVKR